MMRKLAGFLMIFLGLLQAAWVFYNLFVERQPEFIDPPILVGYYALPLGLFYVGYKWMTEKPAKKIKEGMRLCRICGNVFQSSGTGDELCPGCDPKKKM